MLLFHIFVLRISVGLEQAISLAVEGTTRKATVKQITM